MFEKSRLKISKKAVETLDRARFTNGEFRCPRCDTLFLRVRYGGEVRGAQMWCRKCKREYLLEIPRE